MATVAHRLLGISGSLRSQSTNTAVLKSLSNRLGHQAELSLFALNEIPLYNADLEAQTLPASVTALKDAIVQADGLIICSPEYNYGTSGVLKNAPSLHIAQTYDVMTLVAPTAMLVKHER